MKKYFTLFLILFTVGTFITNISAQSKEYGKIFTKTEATQLFGTVTDSAPINYSDLLKALLDRGSVLQFGIRNKTCVITNEKRQLLAGLTQRIGTNDQLAVFSKNMLRQFISASRWMGRGSNFSKYNSASGDDPGLTLEIRASGVTTISAGETVLEMSVGCPPFCDF